MENLQDESFETKEYLIYPDLRFRYFGNRRFFNNGNSSFLPNMIGWPCTSVMIIYSFFHLLFLILHSVPDLNLKKIFLAVHSVMFAFTFFQLFFASFSNPGVIYPRKKNLSGDNRLKTMLANINNNDYFLKYCTTCNIVRDLRVFHCRTCNLCIVRHDHHCPWLSICIGINNHKRFLCLLFLSFVYIGFDGSILSWIWFKLDLLGNNEGFKIQTRDFVFGIILLICLSVVFLFISVWIYFQVIFISKNQTTSETIKSSGTTIQNNYTLNSCIANHREFYGNALNYRTRVRYNDNAKALLSLNEMLIDYILNINNTYPNRMDYDKFLKENFEERCKEDDIGRAMELSSNQRNLKEREVDDLEKGNNGFNDNSENSITNVNESKVEGVMNNGWDKLIDKINNNE